MDLAILGIMTAQFTVLCGIYLRLGGHDEAIKGIKETLKELKDRVTKLEGRKSHV